VSFNLGMNQELLITKLESEGTLKSNQIKSALAKVPRVDFVLPKSQELAYEDIAIPTMSGQTMSQPTTVVFMLEKLELARRQEVLEIGFGSGWVTALIAEVVGPDGRVDAFEISPQVYRFGFSNLSKYKYNNIRLFNQSALDYLVEKSKSYNRIISGAAFPGNIATIREALKVGGVAVIPMQNNSIHRVTRTNDDFVKENYYGFVFVPVVE